MVCQPDKMLTVMLQGRERECSPGGRLQEDRRRDPEEPEPEHHGALLPLHRHPPDSPGQAGADHTQGHQVRAGLQRFRDAEGLLPPPHNPPTQASTQGSPLSTVIRK